MTIPKEARCPKELLHDWVIWLDRPEVNIEYCRFCKKEERFNKHTKTGRLDNTRYYLSHLRDYLQPRGEMYDLYTTVYGTRGLDERRKEQKRKKDPRTELRRIKQEIKDENSFYNKYPSKI